MVYSESESAEDLRVTTWPNWVDLVVLTLFLIKSYNGYQRGFFIEFFRLIGIICVTVVAVNYSSTVTRWVQAWIALDPVLTGFIIFWLFFLSLLFLRRLLLRGLAQLIKWERVHWITQGLGFICGALQGLWWVGLIVLACSSSGFTYLRESVEERSVVGPRLLTMSRDYLERLSDLFPGGRNREPSLIPSAKAVSR